jgi:LysR family hydrogen peroxide-inducible transcriptional activator
MKMQQVRYFLAMCSVLSFSRAAKLCDVSQPTISTAILDLEDELDGPLFHRAPSIALTALGKSVQPHLVAIWRESNRVHKIAKAARQRRRRNSKRTRL